MGEALIDRPPGGVRRGWLARRFQRGQPDNLATWQLMAYGLPALPLQAMIAPISLFLAPFFTGHYGITLSSWALIVGLGSIADVVANPIIGIVCDRLPSRWGRRRHWVVAATPSLMLACALLFTPQYFTSKPTFWYVLVGMMLFNISSAMQNLNISAWGGELSGRYAERSRIQGWRAAMGSISRLMAFGIPAAMEFFTPHATLGDKLQVLMWTAIVLMPLSILIAVVSVPEQPADDLPVVSTRPSFTIGEFFSTLRRMVTNKYLGWILLVDVLQAGPFAVKSALFIFYVSFIMKAPGVSSTLLLFVYSAAVLSMPIWLWVAKGREKHRILAISVLLYGASQASMLFWGPNQMVFFICAIAFHGAMNAGPSFLMQSIMADIVDSDTVLSGKPQTGAFFAVLESTTKLMPSLMVMAIFPLLQALHFDPHGLHNTPQSLNALRITFALAPTIPILLASLLLWNFPLGSKRQGELRAQIEALRASRRTPT